MSVAEARQLGLPLARDPRYGPDFIFAPSNEPARRWLARTAEWPHARLALWGEAGAGKTHLLHRWAAAHGAALVGGGDVSAPICAPDRAAAIDDADRCGDARALLHLLNAHAEARVPVLLAARLPPARWEPPLPDLASRLRAMLAVQIAPAEDALLRALLARLLADRQLAVPRSVQEWLLLRLPRSAAVMREVAARLDAASLAQGGRITRALAARRLADLLVLPEVAAE